MSYGGGIFLTQNKVLPGAYINYSSVTKANSNISDRGYAAMGLELDWGPDRQIFMVEQEDFQDGSAAYYLAQSYRKNGDLKSAKPYYQYVIENYPDTERARTSQNYVDAQE